MDFIVKIKNNFNKTTSEVIEFFNETKEFCQVKNKSKHLKLAIALILIILFNIFILNNEKHYISTLMLKYILILMCLYATTILIYYQYLRNNKIVFKYISDCLFALTFFAYIPLILFFSFIQYLSNMKINNIDGFIVGIFNFIILLLLYSININLFLNNFIIAFAEKLFYLSKNIFPKLDEFAFYLFVCSFLIKFLSNLAYYFILHLEKKYLMKQIYKEKDNIEIDYIMECCKNLLRKFEISIVLFIFVITTFKAIPEEEYCLYMKYESQIVNIVALVSLILLVIDKFKQWDSNLDNYKKYIIYIIYNEK